MSDLSGFTIPKKKRPEDDGGATPPAKGSSRRKVLPARASRNADAMAPEWEAMSKLMEHFFARADAAPFREAVNWKALGLFDYPKIIKQPMDMGTVKRKIREGRYDSVFVAAEDMRLIWKNCMAYNPPGTDFHKLGKHLAKTFEDKYAKLCAKAGGMMSPSKTTMGGRKGKKKADKASRSAASSRSTTPTPRSSGRNAKRKPQAYAEDDLEDTDEDELMTSGEEEEFEKRRQKRLAKKKRIKADGAEGDPDAEDDAGDDADMMEEDEEMMEEEEAVVKYEIDAPPPGHLNCLWYSKEPFLHVFVLEKVLGWKTRPVVKLEMSVPDQPTEGEEPSPAPVASENVHTLDFDEAMKMRDKAIVDTGNDFRTRREISRINPATSPCILKMAADQELKRSRKEGSAPKFKAVKSAEREEVFLVKWRGRSYVHCSWERESDLHKFDQSTQPGAARGKISRWLQNQVIALGQSWKKDLEDGRKSKATIVTHHAHHAHGHGHAAEGSGSPKKVGPAKDNDEDVAFLEPDDEDYFSPLYLEVDRICGCDENELDMNVLARQRALNIRAERQALKKREKEDDEEEKWLKGELESDDGATDDGKRLSMSEEGGEDAEEEWDPEDNVRYIVRWKGLTLNDATWEYWIDIKRDFVDEVEDFWLRQQPPSPEEVEEMAKERHPHPRSFKKMKESPIFGISDVERPIAKLDDDDEDYEMNDAEDSGSVLKLRSYQLEGVNWLLWNWYNSRSCILADEMGLGKTIQSIGFLRELQNLPKVNVRGPFLVVAPLSLVAQWESEAKEWAPDVNAVVYHGSADARSFLAKEEFYYTNQFETRANAQSLKRNHITKFQLLITTYEIVLKEANILSKIHWKALIVDEAHRLKNIKSRLFDDLASVPRDFCLLLTGTPLQNSTEELWALLHFCDPDTFASRTEFTNKFGQLQDADQVANLHTVLRPYLLRRVKEDVEKSLPPKEETILEVTLTPIQKQFYKAIYDKNTAFLFKGTKASNAPSLMNVVMELRKCCNHPFLIKGAEDRIIDDAAEAEEKALTPSEQILHGVDYAKLTGEQLVKSSGKFVLLSKLLPKLYSNGNKVLIFSQMVRVLDLLQELLQLNHYRYERLDGNTSASARTAAVDRFKRESFKRFVMLLSTRAGGLGLNLTAADTVIIFDSDWNPQNDLQAMARAHRIGQTRSVRVYRLLTAKTYEMHMFHSASLKLGLDRAVLAHQRQNTTSADDGSSNKRKSRAEKEEEAKEIDSLLKKGAYDVFNDENDDEAKKFMDTDIDQLLEQSSRKVTYGEAATSSLSTSLGSFSKASFVAGEGEGKDVDLDDPDFWSKAVGLEAPPEEQDETLALIIGDGSKRARRQVQAYDFGAEAEAEEERERLEMEEAMKQEEKEEKERKKLEKFLMKMAEKEERDKKRQEEREMREALRFAKLKAIQEKKDLRAQVAKKRAKQVKIVYNDKATDRKRALKRAEHEDPVFERVKQAWDTSQRNRVVNAILRFGFGRFCKVRHESNFTSLPIQDVEVFTRSYVYQLGLQAASTLLSDIDCDKALDGDIDVIVQTSLHKVLRPLIDDKRDYDWICQAVLTSLCMHMRMKSHDAFVRMPLALAEPGFVYDLRQGVAIWSLHRISFLTRLNSIVEESLDRTILDIGREEMGRRGCSTNDYSTLDADLKARYVSTEELMYALSVKLSPKLESEQPCPPWWDRSCDVGLVMGTFFHGLGNYEAMRNDDDLPFSGKIKSYVRSNNAEAEAYHRFEASADAAKQVFDSALVTMKRKFQEQTAVAVAAVFAAAKESGGDKPDDNTPAHTPQAQRMDDEDIVSVRRLKDATVTAFRAAVDSSSAANKIASLNYPLPFPDSKHLDYLLLQIVQDMESTSSGIKPSKCADTSKEEAPEEGQSPKANTIAINQKLLQRHTVEQRSGHPHVLFAGGLSGQDKKAPDASDYFLGAASKALGKIAVGADSSRYQRGPYVPLVVTKFALGAILQADESVIDTLVNEPTKNGTSRSPVVAQKDELSESTSAAANGEENGDHAKEADAKQPATSEPAWQYIKNDDTLRASLCAALLFGGYPSDSSDDPFANVSAELQSELDGNPALLAVKNCPLFSMEDAFGSVLKSAGMDYSEKKDSLIQYFQSVLLPHCLKLCLALATKQTKIASGHGNTDVYLGRPALEDLSPLPDPFIPLEDHTEEAVAHAYAILRRAKLMKAIRYTVGGGISLRSLTGFLRGTFWCSQTGGIPVWWCPWVHDLQLLVHAALYGLAKITTVLPLQQSKIEQHVRQTFVDGTADAKPALPKSVLDKMSKEEKDAWVEMHSKQFPSFQVIEHRLALICSRLTATAGPNVQYDNVPMFDEGGWPMVEDVSAAGFLADTRASGTRCLLTDYENQSSS